MKDLCTLALVSKPFYVVSHLDEFWKDFCLYTFGGNFVFQGTWKETYIHAKTGFSQPIKPIKLEGIHMYALLMLLEGFFSDSLFNRWYTATVDISRWGEVDNVDRRSNLSLEEFIQEYEIPNKPVIITDIIDK